MKSLLRSLLRITIATLAITAVLFVIFCSYLSYQRYMEKIHPEQVRYSIPQ